MSECNYCILQRLKRIARERSKRVITIAQPRGINAYLVPKGTRVTTFRNWTKQAKDKCFSSWFMELTDRCVC